MGAALSEVKVPTKVVVLGAAFGAVLAIGGFLYMRLGRALSDAYYDKPPDPMPHDFDRIVWKQGQMFQCSKDRNHTQSDLFAPGTCGCGAPKEPCP